MSRIAWAPRGYRELIKREPELSIERVPAESVVMDERRWKILHAVNDKINLGSRYRLDKAGRDTWGIWNMVDGLRHGDCDDYAVEKMKRLLKKGFPRGALLLSVAKIRLSSTYHCTLLVQEEGKDAICLDNRYQGIWRVYSGATLGYDWISQEWPGHGFWWRRMS